MGYFGAEPSDVPLTPDQISGAGDQRYPRIDGGNFGPFSYRNVLDNGAFQVNQRGLEFYGAASYGAGGLIADRWHMGGSAGAVVRIWPNTANGLGWVSMYRDTGTGQIQLIQQVEYQRWAHLKGKRAILSFWVSSSAGNGNLVARVSTADNEGGYTNQAVRGSVTVPSATTTAGRLVSVAFDVPDNAQRGLHVEFLGDITIPYGWNITEIQLEPARAGFGDQPTPFERIPYALDLLNCQRFLYIIGGVANEIVTVGWSYQTNQMIGNVAFPTTMRATPVLAWSNAAHFSAQDGAGGAYAGTNLHVHGSSPRQVSLGLATAGGLTVGSAGRILAPNVLARLYFTAEI